MRFVFLASLLIFAEIALADFDHAMELYGKNDYENAISASCITKAKAWCRTS